MPVDHVILYGFLNLSLQPAISWIAGSFNGYKQWYFSNCIEIWFYNTYGNFLSLSAAWNYKNKTACCVYVAACCQPAWPLLGFSNNGALAGSGWDYWCPSLQAPWGTSEVMTRAETNTHKYSCAHTGTQKQPCRLTLPATFHNSFLHTHTQCRDWRYLVRWLLHLVAICCHYILKGCCTASTVSNMISGLSAIP